jgi:pseudaminic acid biosynthesis-associated methylase
MSNLSEQQEFWANRYAADYIRKNSNFDQKAGVEGWAQMLKKAQGIERILECGSNIGRNIGFLNELLPNARKSLIEISKPAYEFVTQQYAIDQSFNGPIVESNFAPASFDLTFTCGVLIHIHPNDLLANMQKMYDYSRKYILIGEYFNRTPVMLEYQGEKDKLFKSDFGKTFLENFNVRLIDNGFLWGHLYDSGGFDDITWWLFEKESN